LNKDLNLTKEEWLGFAVNKSILKPSNSNECVIGGYIEDFSYDDVDIYDTKFSSVDDVDYWFTIGTMHGWLTNYQILEKELTYQRTKTGLHIKQVSQR